MYEHRIPSSHGHIMTVNEFKQAVRDRLFIDYDGFGHPAKMTMDVTQHVVPSKVDEIPNDATHIVWYNR